MEKNNLDIALEFVKTLNEYSEKLNIIVPILKGLKINNDITNQNIIFFAKDENGIVEQLLMDGIILPNENIDNRINKVIDETERFSLENNIMFNCKYYNEFKNNLFSFKIYKYDIFKTINEKNILVEQFNAFFIEPKQHKFYQLSLSIINEDKNNLLEKKVYDIFINIIDKIKYDNSN